jgi:hypothetical protein
MSGKFATMGALLALVLTAAAPGAAQSPKAAGKKTRLVCCANHSASHAKCCTSGKEAACCHGGKPVPKGVTAVCAISGKPLAQCCGKKASMTPPCCQKGCKHAGHKEG